jgi:hypothetical protein
MGVDLPVAPGDLARWEALRPNSLTVRIPGNVRPDLSWVASLRGLRHLGISGVTRGRVELDALLSALDLETLSINLPNYGLTRGAPAGLRDLSLAPWRNDVHLVSASLRQLWITGLRGVRDLSFLEGVRVRELVLQNAHALESLDGIPREVVDLRIDSAKRLADISVLSELHLISLKLHRCGGIDVPSDIVGRLQELEVNEGGAIPSIRALADAPNLRSLEFYGSTRITDGRVAFLAELPALRDVRFMNRPTYDATRESIRALLEGRR